MAANSFRKIVSSGSKNYNRKGQVTIFVIVALVIVAGIVIYFAVRGQLFGVGEIPAELRQIFDYYDSCIEQEAKAAIELAGSQGGYVSVPEYIPGSEYAPFSSQLNFLGFPVPYWYYVSGNGLIKEQAPGKSDVESGIGNYVADNLEVCDFSRFYVQGFDIKFNERPEVTVNLEDTKVDLDVISELVVSKGEDVARRKNHEVSVNSKLGKFYDLGKKIYEKERNDAIFDSYALDVLRLYAPVDGVEISCSGKVWKTRDVLENLKSGLEANIASIKFKGNYYVLNEKEEEYYVVDLGKNVDENVNALYLSSMPTKVEIVGEGVDDELMIASPVGIQEGLGIMGFCYSPYHFVYDLSFPVLIQIYNNEEIFQFPIVVIIDNNLVKEFDFNGVGFEYLSEESFDLCEFETQDIEVDIYDINLNPVNKEVDVSYQCFDQRCRLGKSENGKFIGKAPVCLNGYLLLRADGYTEKQELFSTNKENVADIILDREHEISLELNVGGNVLGEGESAIVSFVGKESLEGKTITTALPEVKNIKLGEGFYDVIVYVYGSSGIKLGESKKTQCTEVPRSGILGFFGAKKKECFDITIPDTEIEYALAGGGKSETYILESELEKGKMIIYAEELPVPRSLDDLQYNYEAFDEMEVLLDFNEV